MKTLNDFLDSEQLDEAKATAKLSSYVFILERALKFAEPSATKVGKTLTMRGPEGLSHIRKAREATQGIMAELHKLNNLWNGSLL